MSDIDQIVRENLNAVREEIENSCTAISRDPSEVKLVAVTKYAKPEWVRSLYRLHRVFGENRPQQLAERAPQFDNAEWHLIGQLQRNKTRSAVSHASVIHSIDSLRLLRRVIQVGSDLQKKPVLLLQVNVTGEATKSGFAPDELESLWPEILALVPANQLGGLMTMAAASDDPESARPAFAGLRILREQLVSNPLSVEHGCQLPELSMGMSGDFPVAVAEGATMVRVGSRLFEGLE